MPTRVNLVSMLRFLLVLTDQIAGLLARQGAVHTTHRCHGVDAVFTDHLVALGAAHRSAVCRFHRDRLQVDPIVRGAGTDTHLSQEGTVLTST